jgi:Domain of unknown function (DUF4157)
LPKESTKEVQTALEPPAHQQIQETALAGTVAQVNGSGRNAVVHTMQRTIGNQAVLRRLRDEAARSETAGSASHDPSPYDFTRIPISPRLARAMQTKLTINTPGDAYEQEADRVSEQVMRMAEPGAAAKPALSHPAAGVQRKCSCGDTCDDCKKKKQSEEHAHLQMKEAGPASAGGVEAPPIVHEVLRSPGQPLDAGTRDFMEPRFGHDFSGVRIHTDAKAAESAKAVQARAYTVGNHIAFAGQPEPQLLAHELVHVVQQGAQPLRRSPAQPPSPVVSLAQPALQRQTTPTYIAPQPHNHDPSGRWDYVRMHPNSGFWESVACFVASPREVADLAIWRQLAGKPAALSHINWYLSGGGADYNEDANLDRWARSDEHFRRNLMVARIAFASSSNRGWVRVDQAFYGSEEFRLAFGAIDRMDFEIDEVAGTIHLWFKDRYEFHPYYPSLYTRFPDDEARETNCVHAAMVELKSEGAADFWMIGQATLPLRLFTLDPQDELREESAESIRSAGDFIDSLRQQITVERMQARRAVATAGGVAEASRRAHRILNQTGIRARLERGRRIYEAQRGLLDRNHPLLGRFRETYARFLTEVREAFDEALALSRNDRAAETEEQSAYGESLVLWLEASPLHDAALGSRTTFTAADVSASQRQETDLATVLTNIVPNLNLVQPGMPARARNAVNGARPWITATGGAPPARTMATSPTQTAADTAVAQIDQAEQTVVRSRTLLHTAIDRLDVWLQAPTQPVDVADRVNDLFNTRDPGYGALLRSRLQVMLDNMEGHGTLFAHTLRQDDTSNCASPTTLGQTPHAYEFIFCRFSTNVDSNAAVLLHELAHAVIPERGSRGSAETGAPVDRAYEGERLMHRMSTEQALNNAESYAQLILVLAGLPVTATPTDTVTGCANSGPLLDAIALAQSAHRRAWNNLELAQAALSSGGTVDPTLRTLLNTHLGSPSDAELRAMLTDFGNLQADATVWHLGHTFTCVAAGGCPANAVAFDNRRAYRTAGVVARPRSISSTPRICPSFFSLSADDQARVAHMLVSLSFGESFLLRKDKAPGYASLALALYQQDISAPPAASLAEHQAADAPAAPATP